MSNTDKYYEENSSNFISSTKGCDMSYIQSMFLKYIKPQGKILDVGFGSGRDSLAFLSKGYDVYSLDPCEAFIENGKTIGLPHLLKENIEDIKYKEEFDGIFCCASLLHLPKEKLPKVFKLLNNALKKDGTIYISFKYGDFEGIRTERYFTDLTEESLKALLKDSGLYIVEMQVSKSVKVDSDQVWLNAILQKGN